MSYSLNLGGAVPAELETQLDGYLNAISYTDSTGTPGAATANTAAGRVAVASGASSVVVTNNKVTARSIVLVVKEEADTDNFKYVVPAAGSFTINMTGAVDTDVNVRWYVVGAI